MVAGVDCDSDLGLYVLAWLWIAGGLLTDASQALDVCVPGERRLENVRKNSNRQQHNADLTYWDLLPTPTYAIPC